MTEELNSNEDRIRLIAKEEAEKARNHAIGIFAFIGLLLGILAYLGIEFSVQNAMNNSALTTAQKDAVAARDRISEIEHSIDSSYESFRSSDGFIGLASRIDEINARLDGGSEQCRTVRADRRPGENTCHKHANWLGSAACSSGEFLRSVRIEAVEEHGGYTCYFRVDCCSL